MLTQNAIIFSMWQALFIIVCLFSSTLYAQDYPVKGFDISHHQGNIQWKKISPKQYQFVYIKATEGTDYQDPKFQENWLNAKEKGFHVGAYHFYRLCSNGKTQANNFIKTVPNQISNLPPVIDIEYDSKCISTYTKEQLNQEIKTIYQSLEKHYGKKPIIYTSARFYNLFLSSTFSFASLWIRHYQTTPPILEKQHSWFFWQYTKQGHIDGIDGDVDINVYAASKDIWDNYLHYLEKQQ
ncbi:lysozyme [Acinetobacter boissieri]|uniref:Lysozyme n=2 Tax=Acinetobacter boissieri TaxID=1219383 RepID=A0A1G6HHR1_9GAMM|nr:lysozyme [Acinetobacter boissieri]